MALKVNVGDIIQYRYRSGGFIQNDARRVEMISNEGYYVTGGYLVRPGDVLSVIPAAARESAPVETTRFPLEADQ